MPWNAFKLLDKKLCVHMNGMWGDIKTRDPEYLTSAAAMHTPEHKL